VPLLQRQGLPVDLATRAVERRDRAGANAGEPSGRVRVCANTHDVRAAGVVDDPDGADAVGREAD
jgi:hypothetical protein